MNVGYREEGGNGGEHMRGYQNDTSAQLALNQVRAATLLTCLDASPRVSRLARLHRSLGGLIRCWGPRTSMRVTPKSCTVGVSSVSSLLSVADAAVPLQAITKCASCFDVLHLLDEARQADVVSCRLRTALTDRTLDDCSVEPVVVHPVFSFECAQLRLQLRAARYVVIRLLLSDMLVLRWDARGPVRPTWRQPCTG